MWQELLSPCTNSKLPNGPHFHKALQIKPYICYFDVNTLHINDKMQFCCYLPLIANSNLPSSSYFSLCRTDTFWFSVQYTLHDFFNSFCNEDRWMAGSEQKQCEFVVRHHRRSLAFVLGATQAISVLFAWEYLPVSLMDTRFSIFGRKYESLFVSPALSFDRVHHGRPL